MKIMLITQNFYPELGSASNRLGVIFKLLNKDGHDVQILTTEPSYPNKNLFKNSNYYNDIELNFLEESHVYRLNIKSNKQAKSFYKRILYFLEEFIRLRIFLANLKGDYDYIYVTSPNIFLAWGTLFFKKKNIKYVLEIRDLWPDSVNEIKGINIKYILPILKFLEKKMYNSADKIIINNLYFESYIKKHLEKQKPILYLPNSVTNVEIFNNEKQKEFTVIYTGNVGHAQDVRKLLEVAKSLNDKKIYFRAIIYGAQTNFFKDKCKGYKYIDIIDPLPRSECLYEISKSHVALSVLKDSETFLNVLPGKIIDAIGMGTIPITNLGGHTKDLINQNELGFAKENISVEEIIEHIITLKNNKALQNSMYCNNISYRDKNLIWEKNYKNLKSFLEEGVEVG